MSESTYQEALNYLYSLTQSGIKLGLKNTGLLLQYFGEPQLHGRTIHIAGTNGKGSTAAMIESILTTAGYKVGLYTSPHLLDFRERVQINRKLIKKHHTVELITRIRSAVKELNIAITFFEFTTVLAFLHFKEQQTDINVIEVGLGGRLDATNLCQADISIITSIAHDHTQYLGEKLEQIAFEKASIIKSHGTVIANITEGKALKVVEDLATKHSAQLYNLGVDFQVSLDTSENNNNTFSFTWNELALKNLKLPLKGYFQRENSSLALSACLQLKKNGLKIEDQHLREGLEKVSWPGRLEVIFTQPTVVLDCAHNEASVRNMTIELRKNFTFSRCFIVLGIMKDKNIDDVLKILSQLGDQFYLVPVNPPRGEDPVKLAEKLNHYNKSSQIFSNVSKALYAVKQIAQQNDLVCVTGSIYLVAAAKKCFNDETIFFNPRSAPRLNQ
ncbi:MAG: bifunctional folylpolyglutamate synthase/dihydrofolate synthase [Nitrospinaceae bacterium]|jgi:dihydrofolate synthase / folylpolyglutamate synthase|nr:bifunctional folylpolyglutamate synthase/dihydrofolate synthase [Nitrospinaceae bacterium]